MGTGWLHLYENRLSGPIPSELGDLVNLRTLGLGGNPLSGCVPSDLRARLEDGARVGMPFCDELPPPRPCTVGMIVRPGEYCTVYTSPGQGERSDLVFFVERWNIACLTHCAEDHMDIDGFRATRNPDDSWTVGRLP